MKIIKDLQDSHHMLENKEITDNSMHVVVFSPPRSGSTLVYNILSELIKYTTKTHEPLSIIGTEKTIIVFRDPLEWVSSYGRTIYDLSEETLCSVEEPERLWDNTGNTARDMVDQLLMPCIRKYDEMLTKMGTALNLKPTNSDCSGVEFNGRKNILCIKYEDFYKNYTYLFDQLETFLEIKISSSKREDIKAKVNLKAVKKIEEKYSSFKDCDSISYIHGKHTCNNGDGTSHLLVGSSDMSYFKEKIKENSPSPWWRMLYPL